MNDWNNSDWFNTWLILARNNMTRAVQLLDIPSTLLSHGEKSSGESTGNDTTNSNRPDLA
jgi:hypothetical protein